MAEKNDLEKMLVNEKPYQCTKCGGVLTYKGLGRYMCERCQTEVLDDFGKIKAYLEVNGPTPAMIIAKATGVDRETINYYLRKGRVEIPEGSNFYLKCEKCGCNIKYGRYCPECVKIAENRCGIVLSDDMGERPRRKR